jgi:hypothetical protein
VGGATSGVSQDDLLNTKYNKGSMASAATDIAKSEFADTAKAAVSSYFKADSLNKMGKGISELPSYFKDVAKHGSFKDAGARVYGWGADDYAQKVSKQGLIDNPWLAEDYDFWGDAGQNLNIATPSVSPLFPSVESAVAGDGGDILSILAQQNDPQIPGLTGQPFDEYNSGLLQYGAGGNWGLSRLKEY